MTTTCKSVRSGKAVMVFCGTFGVVLATGYSAQALEVNSSHATVTNANTLALELNDRSDLESGSFYCVNNGDPICDNPGLYTSPWDRVPNSSPFAPDGFRGQYYDSIEAGTGPDASQQSSLQEALAEYYDYLENSDTAACINNTSSQCD